MADVFGQLFSADSAEKDFGEELYSVEVETSVIQDALKNAGKYLMFNIVKNGPVILTDQRKILHNNANARISNDLVFSVYSVERVKDLLEQGGSKTTKISRRQGVMTITNGNMLLEMASYCPPLCA